MGLAEGEKYWAFISYSHQDNRISRPGSDVKHVEWAEWLIERLETYKLPQSLRSANAQIPARLYPVFQDEKELPTSADLGNAIRSALDESKYLVVICSPRSAKSIYVNEEVRYFKSLGRANRILPIIIDGEPNASDATKTGVPVEQECFCPALRFCLTEDKQNIKEGVRDIEPICADVRYGDDKREVSKRLAASAADLLDYGFMKLVAGIAGVGFDDLVHRDRQRQEEEKRKKAFRIRMLASIGVLGLAILAGVTIVAWKQKQKARAKQQELAASVAEQADRSFVAKEYEQAVCEAAQALVTDSEAAGAKPVQILKDSLITGGWLPVAAYKTDGHVFSVSFDNSGSRLGIVHRVNPNSTRVQLIQLETGATVFNWQTNTVDRSGRVVFSPDENVFSVCEHQFSLTDNKVLREPEAPDVEIDSAVSWIKKNTENSMGSVSIARVPNTKQYVCWSDDEVAFWDSEPFNLRHKVQLGNDAKDISCSPFGIYCAVVSDRKVRVISPADGVALFETTIQAGVEKAIFSPDGRILAVIGSPYRDSATKDRKVGSLRLIELATGSTLKEFEFEYAVSDVSFSPDGKWLAIGTGDDMLDNAGAVFVYRAGQGVPSWSLKRNEQLLAATLSPNCSIVAASYSRRIDLINPISGTVRDRIECVSRPELVRFSLDQQKLVVYDRAGNMSIYDINSTPVKIKSFKVPDQCTVLAVDPSAKYIGVGSRSDYFVKVYDDRGTCVSAPV